MAGPSKRVPAKVELVPAQGGQSGVNLALDGKRVYTPAGHMLTIAHLRLAEAIAQEWRAQREKIEHSSMPMTRLAMSVADHVAPRLEAVRNEALAYAKTDLLCYRAADPERLFERQFAAWQPFLDWAADVLGARLDATANMTVANQDPVAFASLREAVGSYEPYRLLALHSFTAKFSSLVLALAVLHGRVDALEALQVSRLDEIFQAETWGSDAEAQRRAEAVASEIGDLARFLSLLD